jgi:multiple sugar transport system ATP-binding protein
MTLADKIVVLNKGRVEQVGRPLELYNAPASLFVAGFIGSPQMNFITGDFARQFGATTVGVRPEHLNPMAGGPIKGILKHLEQLGNETFAYIDTHGLGEITARMDGTLSLEPGGAIELGYASENLFRFDAAGLRI